MVIPMQAETSLLGPPPPAVTKALHGIRWCVLAMYSCVIIRLAQGDGLLPALSDLIPAIAGTYLLRDDPWFTQCHRCLQSVSSVTEGGLTCLPSFMLLSGMNGTLGLVRALAFGAVGHHPGYLPFLLFISALVYLAACLVCCWAWKAMQRSRAGLLDDVADVEHGGHELSRRDGGWTGATNPAAAAAAAAMAWQRSPPLLRETSEDDPAIRAAIQASMRSQDASSVPLADDEEDSLLMAAILQSQAAALAGGGPDPETQRVLQQSEAAEGRRIVEEQNAEFEESLAVDQAREQSERDAREAAQAEAVREEQRAREEKERLEAEEAERQRLQKEKEAEALRAAEEKRGRLPAEPAAGEPGRVVLLFRLPSGQRRQRAFRDSDAVGSLYDFVDTEDPQMAESPYCLVTPVPRKMYKDREQTLQAAGVENQSVVLAEVDD